MMQEIITRLNDGSIDSQMLIGLLDMGAKGLLLMAAAGLAAAAMRKHAAAARHVVWMLALCGLLLMPVVSVLMPKWTLPILPAPQAPTAEGVAPVSPLVAESDSIAMVRAPSAPIAPPVTSVARPTLPPAPPSLPMTISPASSLKTISYPAWLLAIWLAVAFLTLSPFVAGVVAVSRMRRRAESFADREIQSLAATLAQTMGLKGTPRLLRGPIGAMPMATGFFTPAVFLPADALEWSGEKQRAVLLHELAHVKRRDCLTHALARVATSLHWFNPLAWLALRQLRIEREHACDDLVLAAGERPSAYAENLLEIARTLRAKSVVSAAAITMAQKSQLEGRLLAVLDAARNRGRVTKTLLVTSTFSTITVLTLLAVVDVARSEPNPASFELTYAGGHIATVIAVSDGTLEKPDIAWGPDGNLLSSVPEPRGFYSPAPPGKGKIKRQFYVNIQEGTSQSEVDEIGVRIRMDSFGGGEPAGSGGSSTAMVFSAIFDQTLNQVGFDVGIASGSWQTVTETTFGQGAIGKSGEFSYEIILTDPYTRDGETYFSATHSNIEQQWRIVLFDHANNAHKTGGARKIGIGGVHQAEFALNGIAPEEVKRIELQVRDYEWKKFEGIAVHPNATHALVTSNSVAASADPLGPEPDVPSATEKSQERDFAVTYSAGHQARVVAIGNDGEGNYGDAWGPDGALLSTVPELFKEPYRDRGSSDGEYRRLLVEIASAGTDTDISVAWRLDGDGGGSWRHKKKDNQLYIQTKRPVSPKGSTLEIGISAGPWESVHGTAGPHSTLDGSTFSAAYSDFSEKDGKARVVVTHTPREDDYRLVVYDKNDSPYPTQKGSSSSIGAMRQTEFEVEGDVSASDLLYMDLQARPYEWKSISGIAMRPSEPVAEAKAKDSTFQASERTTIVDPSIAGALPDVVQEVESSNSPDSLPPYSTRFSDGVVATVQSVGEPDEQTTVRAWSPAGDLMTIEPLLVDNYFGEKTLLPGLQRRRIRVQFSQPELLTEPTLRFRVNGHWGGGIPHRTPDSTIYIVQTDVPDRALGEFEIGIASEPWTTSFDINFPVEDATNSPTAHPWRFEEDEYQSKVVIDSVELDNDYRLYVTGHDGTVYHEMGHGIIASEGGGRVEYHLRYGDTSKNIKGLQFLVRDMEWRTIPGLALHPSSSTPEDAALAEEIRRKRLEPDYHDHELTWGPAINGYQCAWRITRPKDHYAIGETIPTEIVVRNTHSTTKMLTIQTSALGQGGTVYRADGSTVPLTREKLRSRPGGLGREIPPGESVAVHGPTLVMLDADTADATVYAGALIARAGRGELEVALNVRLTQFPHEASSTPGEYMMETLQTGKVKFQIQEADGG